MVFLKFPHVSVIFVRIASRGSVCLLLYTDVIKQIRQPQPRLQTEIDFTHSYYPTVSKLSELLSFITGDI